MAVAPGTRLGPYEILSPIGVGGMGEVWKARDTRLDRRVAIKFAKQNFSERFQREARAVAALNHPHICQLYDVGPDYLVMEYIEGQPLAGPLPPGRALEYGRQICSALDAAHRKGIVHRDLKPANILATATGVKLLDFGLAKLPATARENDDTATLAETAEGVVLGTLRYMSPEQVQGKEVDGRSDLFSFGLVLHEMLTGRPVFAGDSAASVIASILKDEPPPLGEVQAPAGTERILRRCLQKDAEQRWQNARDLMLEFAEVESAPDGPRAPAPAMRRGWLSMVMALVLAAVLIAGAFEIGRRGRGTPQVSPSQPLITYSLPPPAGLSLGVFDATAISPDGSVLAFTATNLSGETQLWLHSISGNVDRILDGTEGATFPFWSPDTAAIGFFARGKLKTVEASSGTVKIVCDAPSGRGGSWGRNGVIVFTPGADSGLFQVSAAGGEAKPLTVLDRPRGELSHRWPFFLPDGDHFLYSVHCSKSEESGIWIGSLQSGGGKLLLTVESNAEYAVSARGEGLVLFGNGGTVVAQPFDRARLELTGESFRVAERLVHSQVVEPLLANFSVFNGGLLVYQTGRGSDRLTWFDRAGVPLGTLGDPGQHLTVALSPDGKEVAVDIRDPRSGNYDIWRLDPTRGVASRFTFEPGDLSPLWAPDGSRIVFSRTGPRRAMDLYEKSITGAGGERLLLKTDGFKIPAAWSPDGRNLIYWELDSEHGNRNLWVMPMTGGEKPWKLTKSNSDERDAAFSPDGKWLAYSSDRSGRRDVWIQPFPAPPGGADRWMVSVEGGSRPMWSRATKELFYLAPDNRIMAVPVGLDRGFHAGVPKALFQVNVVDDYRVHFALTADGSRFLIPVADAAASPSRTVVVNWLAGIKP